MTVDAWRDPAVEAVGHRPGSAYIEHVYLGLLGPSATWLWMRTARVAAQRPGTSIDMTDLAVSLGLGASLAPHSALTRTVNRLALFDAVRIDGEHLAVRLALPNVPVPRQSRLSVSARLAHRLLTDQRHSPTAVPAAGPTTGVGL